MKNFLSSFLLLTLTISSAHAELIAQSVEYQADKVTLKGYLAYDDSLQDKRPGVLVVHEWWGHNEYARQRARMLAELGYTALAVDMYGDGKNTQHPKEAKNFMMEVLKNMEVGKARFMAALNFLKQQPSVNPDKIAAIGYCFWRWSRFRDGTRRYRLGRRCKFSWQFSDQKSGPIGQSQSQNIGATWQC
jgi:hypothetical protein